MSFEARVTRLERSAHVGADCLDVGAARRQLNEDIALLATWPAARPIPPPVPSGDSRLDGQRAALWEDNAALEAMIAERRQEIALEARRGTIPPDGQSIDPGR